MDEIPPEQGQHLGFFLEHHGQLGLEAVRTGPHGHQVDAEGPIRERPRLMDPSTQLGRTPTDAADVPETTGVAHGGGQFRSGDAAHAGLENRRVYAAKAGDVHG